MASIDTLNRLALVVFFVTTVAYHAAYSWLTRRWPAATEKGKLNAYRRDWCENIIRTRNTILAVQAMRNHIMTQTFLASSLLLALAFFMTQGIQPTFFQEFHIENRGWLLTKVYLLLGLWGVGFLMLLLSLRLLSQFNILIGTSPELIIQTEGMDAADYLARILNRAMSRQSYGFRAAYFSLPVIAWLFSTLAFIVGTVLIWLWVVLMLDTRNIRAAKPRV